MPRLTNPWTWAAELIDNGYSVQDALRKVSELSTDFMMEVAAGRTPYSSVNKFGRATAITTGNTWEVWDGNAAYSFPATALITSLSQTTDQGDMQGENIEIQGLDANWNLITQTFPLNASDTTTPVVFTATTDAVLGTTGVAMIRVFRMKVLADFVSTSPIRVHNVGETVDYAIISTGNNQTLMAIYTVPANKAAYVTNYYATANPGGGAPTKFNVSLWAIDNANSYEAQLKHIQGVSADADAYGRMQHFFQPYYKFTEKTDIILKGSPTGASVNVSAGFDLILEDA